ncbi:MAG TPA: Uma2 family endonuclease [Pyrinomonadaceae bacterium]|nr:Uma2 family endonuclease [Pyrinomonadaceae bacterium]
MASEVLEQATEERLIRRRASVEEFWSLPESVLPTEYIDGEIVMAPSPSIEHQSASKNIFRRLDRFAGEAADQLFYSPLDVILPSGDVVQPDIFFLSKEDVRRAKKQRRISCAPLLVVEILSPGSVRYDTLKKRDLYERNGVREYWMVDVEERSVSQLVLRKKHYVLTELGETDVIKGAVLAGFEIKVGELLSA